MEAVENGDWCPIKAGRNGPEVSHLMFADDLLLIGKANEHNMCCVSTVLNLFCSMSSQMASHEKKNILFSKNVDRNCRNMLTEISGFNATTSMGKYLGVPLLGRSPRKSDFTYLINKVKAKISGWKSQHLPFAGWVTLSKSVIQALPIYTMMTMPLSKFCTEEIHKLQRHFIWGDTADRRCMHLINWNTLC